MFRTRMFAGSRFCSVASPVRSLSTMNPATTRPPSSETRSGRVMSFSRSCCVCVGASFVFATTAVTSVSPPPSERVVTESTRTSGICDVWKSVNIMFRCASDWSMKPGSTRPKFFFVPPTSMRPYCGWSTSCHSTIASPMSSSVLNRDSTVWYRFCPRSGCL